VEGLPTLLHISLFLFFVGLATFLCHVDLTIFGVVLSWIGACVALYGCITFMPIFFHDSPYYTPLSFLAWIAVTGIPYVAFWFLQWLTFFQCFSYEAWDRCRGLKNRYHKSLAKGLQKTIEETALNLTSARELITRAFMSTFNSLDEDHELERFFAGLPGFRSSKLVEDPLRHLNIDQKKKLSKAALGLFNRTFSSDLVPESVKSWRAIICARALDPEIFTAYSYSVVMQSILFGDECRVLQTTKFGHTLRGWCSTGNEGTSLVSQAIVNNIIAQAQQRDDLWFILASKELGVGESVLRDYAAHGDSLSLAILVHLARRHFGFFWKPFWPGSFWRALQAASKFNSKNTSPELQHEFCCLWNEVVLKVRSDDDRWMAFCLLGTIRNVYIALHQNTKSAPTRFSTSTLDEDNILRDPSSYPLCDESDHIHSHSASKTSVSASFHGNVTLIPASTVAPNLSVPTPLHKTLTDVPLADNEKYIPEQILSARLPAIENIHIPATSLDPVTAHVIQGGIKTSTKTIPLLSTSEFSAATLVPISNVLTLPPGDVADLHTTHRSTPPVVSAPSSPAPVIAGVRLIGPPLSLDSHVTGSDDDLC